MKQIAFMLALAVTVGLAVELLGISGIRAQTVTPIIATRDAIEIEILPRIDALFTSELSLVLPSGNFFIATNREVGTIVRIAPPPAESELIFEIFVRETGQTFRTGPAEANPDNVIHATTESLGGNIWVVGFEDLEGGGDFDFDDMVFQVELTPAPAQNVQNTYFALRRKGMDDAVSACQYYKAIKAVEDCNGGTPVEPIITFNGWKLRNGLSLGTTPSTDEFTAFYLNAEDLNLGREMHGKRTGQDVAYYVCNYPSIEDAIAQNDMVQACVAMEYSALRDAVDKTQRLTKFYVFDPKATPEGKLLLSAALDFQGEKFVPGLCVACHGGDTYPGKFPADGTGTPDIGARFLPFDLNNLAFSEDPDFTKEEQEEAFKQLNELIRFTNIKPVVKQLLDGWYCDERDQTGGCIDPRDDQNTEFVPKGWDCERDPFPGTLEANQFSPKELYLDVVRPFCRTCHSVMSDLVNWNRYKDTCTTDNTTLSGGISGSFGDFAASILPSVCGMGDPKNRTAYMPNAEVTLNRFWLGHRTPPGGLPTDKPPDIFSKFLKARLNRDICPPPAP